MHAAISKHRSLRIANSLGLSANFQHLRVLRFLGFPSSFFFRIRGVIKWEGGQRGHKEFIDEVEFSSASRLAVLLEFQ